MIKIALVTENQLPNLTDDDRLLISPLKKLGFNVVPAVWDDASIDWKEFKTIVFRSCWRYYLKINEFKNWLEKIQSQNNNIWNPVEVIRWNIDKIYLFELAKRGIKTIPTFKSVKDIDFDSKDFIIKPRFGTDSYKVQKLSIKELKNVSTDYLIQPFIQEVIKKGELSIIFINNNFSHAIRKIPKKGEFRMGDIFRPRWIKEDISKDYINKATKIIKLLNLELLYARIDVVEINGELLIMEIELTEPFLYFGWYKQSVDLFIKALVSKIS